MASDVIPFGKYKGKTVGEVAARDPQYLEWLTQQAWFEERFDNLANSIGFRAEDTPEHNAMQVRFLDERLRWQVAKAVTGFGLAEGRAKAEEYAPTIREQISAYEFPERRERYADPNCEGLAQQANAEAKKAFYERKAEMLDVVGAKALKAGVGEPVFECGTDVAYHLFVQWPIRAYLGQRGTTYGLIKDHIGFQWDGIHERFAIECKPTVGDDFPAILRQVTKQKVQEPSRKVLFVGEYSARGATREQFIKVFANSGISVLFQAEVEVIEV